MPVAGSHKRPCEDEDNELDVVPDPASPRSHPPLSHTGMPNMEQLTPMAMTTTRKKPVLELWELKESEMVDVGDFGEAEFFPNKLEMGSGHADEI